MTNKCCTDCFSEPEIKEFIESDGIIGDCDYCSSKNVYVCPVLDVGGFIMEGIERHYEDAANQVSYVSSEGEYLLPTKEVDDILLWDEGIFGDSLEDPTSLLEDLVSNDGTAYVRRDPYGPPSGEPEEIWYWEKFCETVKTKQRFLFLSSKDEEQHDYRLPSNFLFRLAHHFMPTLIHVLTPETRIYRARINSENKKLWHEDLTSPPQDRSRNTRMSPAGISCFYGGMTPEVCIHEVRPSVADDIVVADFEIIKELFVLDLTIKGQAHMSIFNPEYSFTEEEYFKPFLEHFARDIAKAIRKSNSEIEYVPTQVFCEFIRSINFKKSWWWPDINGNQSEGFVHGIIFNSSIMKNGKNLALFKGPEISTADRANPNDAWLFYSGQETHRITDVKVKSTVLNAGTQN